MKNEITHQESAEMKNEITFVLEMRAETFSYELQSIIQNKVSSFNNELGNNKNKQRSMALFVGHHSS